MAALTRSMNGLSELSNVLDWLEPPTPTLSCNAFILPLHHTQLSLLLHGSIWGFYNARPVFEKPRDNLGSKARCFGNGERVDLSNGREGRAKTRDADHAPTRDKAQASRSTPPSMNGAHGRIASRCERHLLRGGGGARPPVAPDPDDSSLCLTLLVEGSVTVLFCGAKEKWVPHMVLYGLVLISAMLSTTWHLASSFHKTSNIHLSFPFPTHCVTHTPKASHTQYDNEERLLSSPPVRPLQQSSSSDQHNTKRERERRARPRPGLFGESKRRSQPNWATERCRAMRRRRETRAPLS